MTKRNFSLLFFHLAIQVSIKYRSVDTYNIMEEKELFTWSQMVCQIGGFLGIIIGMSVMSVVEVLVYVVLLLAHRLGTLGKMSRPT